MGIEKEQPLFEKICITDIGAEGNALARINNQVVFVPMLIPGDVVDIKVIRKRKKYLEGRVVRFHEYSPARIKPVCRHFGTCGGCRWQHLPYHLQLQYKEKQVRDSLERIGRVEIPRLNPIIGSPEVFFYRNKLEYTFSERRWLTREEIMSDNVYEDKDALGFHVRGFFDKVLDVRECYLQPEPSNSIRERVRLYAHKKGLKFFNMREQTGFLRNLIIRNSREGKIMVIVVFFHDEPERRKRLLDFLASEFPAISSLMYVINPKRNDSIADLDPVLYRGDDHLIEEMEGLRFKIGPKSFYQTNTLQALQLYRTAKEFAGLTGNEIVYDLYSGTGTIANFVAGSAAKVIGIECVEEAVKDSVVNTAMNNIKNVSFFTGDIKDILTGQFISVQGKPDVIITDPPRAGMHSGVVSTILSAAPERIVYISCNPATQARDIFILSEKYNVAVAQPVDMFPHTHHVENVILLTRNLT